MKKAWYQWPGTDFHLHSTASDGSRTPEELVDLIVANGLYAFSLTDHDTLAGIPDVEQYLKKREKEGIAIPLFIPGVELSVHFDQQEIHLLAYFPGGSFERIAEFLERQRRARVRRNKEILAKLDQMGYHLRQEDIPASQKKDSSWGRLHIAEALVEKGYFKKIGHAFQELLSVGRPAYVARQKVPLDDAVSEVKSAGGMTVVAHPQKYGWCKDSGKNMVDPILMRKCRGLKRAGVDGLEAGHGDASQNQREQMLTAAIAFDFIVTAGSDDHGLTTPHRAIYAKDQRLLPEKTVLVVCALIEDEAGRLLLGRRAPDQYLPGFYEMPGGKVKPGETKEMALEREIKEELGVASEVGRLHSLLWNVEPDRFIALAVLEATLEDKETTLTAHDDLLFVYPQEAKALNVLPADISFIDSLIEARRQS